MTREELTDAWWIRIVEAVKDEVERQTGKPRVDALSSEFELELDSVMENICANLPEGNL